MNQIYILNFLLMTLPLNLLGNSDMFFDKQEVIAQHFEPEDDSCIIADKIKKTILGYLHNENEVIYTKEFISSFIENHNQTCFFPRNNDEINLYFKLSDSLLKKINKDKRAIRLLIDLYLVNWINVEFSEHYALDIIPNAAITNLRLFVDALSTHSEKDINKCVSTLKYLDTNDKVCIEKTLSNMKKANQQMIINKIKKIITST